jgi:hypothetical protein
MWIFNNKQVKAEDIPTGAIGFIYLITNLTNNKKYIGKKLLTMASSKQVKGKKIKTRKPSDWVNYWSSCKELKDDVLLLGADKFKREILYFTYTISTHTYLEEREQYDRRVLESEDYYNENIGFKILKKNILNKIKN